MWTGINFLLVLQDLRLSLPDLVSDFFKFISLSEFQYFIPVLLMAVLFWCFRKKDGELLMFNFGFSNIVGYVVKNIVKQPRPWIIDPALDPDQAAREGAPGYSLPSGHTTSAVSSYGTMARLCRNPALKVTFLSLVVLIPFARMYLSVHTPLDIIVAIVIVIVVCYINHRALEWSYKDDRNRLYVLLGYFLVGLILSIVCDIFAGKVLSNKMCGFCTFLPICLLIEERYVRYEVPSTSLKDRLLSAVPGLVIAMVIMEAATRLIPTYGVTIGLTGAIVFIILIYPMAIRNLSSYEHHDAE